jgi:hypothetical protein
MAYPPLLEEIIVAGARSVVVKARSPRPVVVDIEAAKERRRAQAETIKNAARDVVERVEIGARAVELLDSIKINGKMLGDCTRDEVLAEAGSATRRSAALAERAEWLRSLAAVMRPDQTVRKANRAAVLAILKEAS